MLGGGVGPSPFSQSPSPGVAFSIPISQSLSPGAALSAATMPVLFVADVPTPPQAAKPAPNTSPLGAKKSAGC